MTGHRSGSLGDQAQSVADRITDAVGAITAAALNQFSASRDWFAPLPPQLMMVSPLADGADQFAADAAIANGFGLQVVLPFPRERTSDGFMRTFREVHALIHEEIHGAQ